MRKFASLAPTSYPAFSKKARVKALASRLRRCSSAMCSLSLTIAAAAASASTLTPDPSRHPCRRRAVSRCMMP